MLPFKKKLYIILLLLIIGVVIKVSIDSSFLIWHKFTEDVVPSNITNCVLSYTLFGSNSWKDYGENVVNVANEAKESGFYNTWTVRLYHDNFPIEQQLNLTKQYKNLEFIDIRQIDTLKLPLVNAEVSNIININAMTWRFLPLADNNVDVICSRDLDSPLSEREEDAVMFWLESGKIMHSMRDNPVHGVSILGGLWCFRNSKNRMKAEFILNKLLRNAEKRDPQIKEAQKGNDQDVLDRFMWPVVKKDTIQHDSFLCKTFPGSIPFPSQRKDGIFIGCKRNVNVNIPCERSNMTECPKECRPIDHQDWRSC